LEIVRTRGATRALPTALGLTLVAATVGAYLVLAGTATYDVATAIALTPLFVVLSLPALARQARRESDRRLFYLLVAALAIKLAATWAHYHIDFHTYAGQIDASRYDSVGRAIAERFARGDFHTGLPDLSGTNFIMFLTGVVYWVIGPTTLGGYLTYSWLGFWGLFLLYRAYREGMPEGQPRQYGWLVFFLPSLVFWPSNIGKEAWMMFSLGIVALGAAKLLAGITVRALLLTVIGLWFASIVRPPVAGLLAVSLAAAYLVRPPSRRLRHLRPLAKVAGLMVLGVLALMLIQQTSGFLERAGVQTDQGITGVLAGVTHRTERGDSEFNATIVNSPSRIPMAIVTVLFRPFITEAENGLAQAAAIESLFLLILLLVRLRWVWAAVKSARRQPYVVFAATFVLLFVLAFASLANFGTLVRERMQMLPFFLVLLTVRPRPPIPLQRTRPLPSLVAAGSAP
jgi:hypothetical protein